jgi:NADH:ubiquinone oxidoreductase subunit C
MFKVTISKKTAAGWDKDWASGQLEHMASYHSTQEEADEVAEAKDAELLESICDGLGLDYDDEADREKANERREQFYHVLEVEDAE